MSIWSLVCHKYFQIINKLRGRLLTNMFSSQFRAPPLLHKPIHSLTKLRYSTKRVILKIVLIKFCNLLPVSARIRFFLKWNKKESFRCIKFHNLVIVIYIGFKKIKIKDMFSGVLKFECLEKHCNIKALLVNMNMNTNKELT